MSEKIYMTDGEIEEYLRFYNMKKNVLCPILKLGNERQSINELSEDAQISLKVALRPKCVTRVETLLYNDGLMMLLCASRGENQVLIGRHEDKNVLSRSKGENIPKAMLSPLFIDSMEQGNKAYTQMNLDSFLMLIAIADTYKARYLSGLLNHEANDEEITLKDLTNTLEESYSKKDTRWLFPFLLMVMSWPKIEKIDKALQGLGECGILKPNELELTEEGQRLVDELMYRKNTVHFNTVRVREEKLIQEDILFIATQESLWCATLGDEVKFFTLSSKEIIDLVTDITEELDEPKDMPESKSILSKPKEELKIENKQVTASKGEVNCSNCGTLVKGEAKFCQNCGKPRPVEVSTSSDNTWVCSCGRVNKGGFCPQCGKKREDKKADGSWKCSCGRINKGSFCPKCGAKRP